MDLASANALITNSTTPIVAIINNEEFNVTVIRDDPATIWLRLWNQSCGTEDRLYLKVGAAEDKEIKHVKRAKQAWCGRFALFTVTARDVKQAFASRPAGKTVYIKVTKEVH